jgi:hypothetical protein
MVRVFNLPHRIALGAMLAAFLRGQNETDNYNGWVEK